jgi:hypothetical protein
VKEVSGYIDEVIVRPGRSDIVVLKLLGEDRNIYFLRQGGTIQVHSEVKSGKGSDIVQIEDLAKIIMRHPGSVAVTLHPVLQYYGASQNAEFVLIKPEAPEK